MKNNEAKAKVLNGDFSKAFDILYGDTESPKDRYTRIVDGFCEKFGDDKDIEFFSAPGRTEVGGNHTDHQHGRVLCGSVNLDVVAVAAKNGENIVRIKSEGFPMDTIDLTDLEPREDEIGEASGLIRGMCACMKDAGFTVEGFDAYTTNNVIKGSGLSSSAAFEVVVGVIISGLFNNNNLDSVTNAKFAQKAENIYFGKPCGLMDQMACSVGGFTAIDFCNPEKPVIEKVNFRFRESPYSLCIVNTGGNHADLTADYAAIPAECREVANYFGKDFLREVNEEKFFASIKELREKVSDRAVLRAIHFFEENNRAMLEKDVLKSGDIDGFIRLVNESGNSSYKYLQNVYSSAVPDQQGVSLALAVSEKLLSGKGAHRVHGGGFAGTIQAFVPKKMLNTYKKGIEAVFGENSCYVLNIRSVGGTPVLPN